jgi:DNA-binding response OmpR family regulator
MLFAAARPPPGDLAMRAATARTHVVLVFSDDPTTRDQVRTAVGRRPAPDLGRVEYVECATGEEVVARVDAGGVDVAILDGEAQPTGGMGISRQLKNEIADCPAVCVLLGRQDDRWLATWSLADATIARPLDPVRAAEVVAGLLRDRVRGLPVVR